MHFTKANTNNWNYYDPAEKNISLEGWRLVLTLLASIRQITKPETMFNGKKKPVITKS